MQTPDDKVDIQPFNYAVSIIGGKWKMLSNKLKELETNGLVIRHEYPGVSPKVEYYLSEKGISLMPVIQTICQWGHEHINDSGCE